MAAPAYGSLVLRHWRRLLCFGLPAVLTPMILVLPVPTPFYCLYATALLDLLFILNVLPSAMIALVPAFLIPILGSMSTSRVAEIYFAKNQLFLLGCLSIAAAFYESTLSSRCALVLLERVGSDGRRVMSFVVLSTVLCGYVFNTYITSLLMLPIVDSLTDEICLALLDPSLKDVSGSACGPNDDFSPTGPIDAAPSSATKEAPPTPMTLSALTPVTQAPPAPDQEEMSSQFVTAENVLLVDSHCRMYLPRNKDYTILGEGKTHILKYRIKLRKILLTGLLYGATIGQTATPQSPVYEELIEYMQVRYPEYQELGRFTYTFYSLPAVMVCAAYLWCNLFRRMSAERLRIRRDEKQLPHNIFHNRHQVHGPWTFGEGVTLVISLLVLLCAAMPNELVTFVFGKRDVSQLTLVLSLALLLYTLPANPCPTPDAESVPILPWSIAKARIPWSCVLLIACGSINATYFVESGMDDMIKRMMQHVSHWPSWACLVVLSLLVCIMSECTNNTKGIGFLLYTLDKQAEEQKVNPLQLMLPASRLSTATFIFAMSSYSNALLKDYGGLSTFEMINLGGQLHLLFLGLELVSVLTVGSAMFKLNAYPYWAAVHNTSVTPELVTLVNESYGPSSFASTMASSLNSINWTTIYNGTI